MKNVTLRGIVVAGDNKAEAENHYRSVALGTSVKPLISEEDGFMILSNASDTVTLANPLKGTTDLVPAPKSVVGKLQFLSASSDAKVQTFYTLCSDGCGAHIIADDKTLMEFCPVCASELQDLTDEQILAAQEPADVTTEPEIVAVASTKADAVAEYRKLVEHEGAVKAFDCGQGTVIASADAVIKFSPYTGNASVEVETVPEFKAVASAPGKFPANLFICASSDCGSHIVSSTEHPVFCPVCASGLVEPDEDEDDQLGSPTDAVASVSESKCDDDDEEEDEDDIEEDEESEEDEDEDSDEDEDDESDEDDEESEDDESEDDEEEDEDMDDDNSLSVSASAGPVGAAPQGESEVDKGQDRPDPTPGNDNPAVPGNPSAPAQPDAPIIDKPEDSPAATASTVEPVEIIKEVEVIKEVPMAQTAIATDLLKVVASASGELKAESLFLSFASNVGGDSKWIAFYGETPVAVASATGSKHKDIFTTAAFGNVVTAHAKANGVNAALEEFGFKVIATTIDVDTYVQENIAEQVETQVATARSEFEQHRADLSERYRAALATAAAGINNNFFQDVDNPVKGSLVATLEQVGVRNAETLIQTAFASGNQDYVTNMVNKADEIMLYDLAVQNQLTTAIASSSQSKSGIAPIGKPATLQKIEQPEPVQIQQKPHVSVSSGSQNLRDIALQSLGNKTHR